jgi:hypothetical protein
MMRTMPYKVVPISKDLSLLGLMISLSSTRRKRGYATNYMISTSSEINCMSQGLSWRLPHNRKE